MRLNVGAFFAAQTSAAAILYAVCSLFVAFLPDVSLRIAEYAFHADLSNLTRPFGFGAFVAGLLLVSLGWGLLSLLAASVYNSLTLRV